MNESNNVDSREVFLCLMGSIAILSLSLSCSSFWDEKPCDFTSKCSGKDYIILCENQGHMWEDYEPVAYKCSEGTFCLEDGQYADCVISDIPCPEGSWTFCNNNEIYYCSFIKYAYESQPCSKNLPFCIDVAAKDANGPQNNLPCEPQHNLEFKADPPTVVSIIRSDRSQISLFASSSSPY